MTYQVYLTDDATADLKDLYRFVKSHDCVESADYILDKISEAFASLSDNPERAAIPFELQELGITDYREIFFKPYRIIYRVSYNNMERNVYVMLIVDGRRDMQSLLQRRLLKPI